MKRILLIVSLFAYLLSTVGIDVQIHYCDGELSQVTFVGSDANCGCEDEDDDCCENEHYHFKNQTEHKTASEAFSLSKPMKSVAANRSHFVAAVKIPSSKSTTFDSDKGLPGCYKLRRHLVLCKFTC
ncbi:MAG: hypothetical protein EXR21_03890 [Flavobacteriaceae bacterium]|nr:hypothetical protein [Flavobacteriaceae bacterium]